MPKKPILQPIHTPDTQFRRIRTSTGVHDVSRSRKTAQNQNRATYTGYRSIMTRSKALRGCRDANPTTKPHNQTAALPTRLKAHEGAHHFDPARIPSPTQRSQNTSQNTAVPNKTTMRPCPAHLRPQQPRRNRAQAQKPEPTAPRRTRNQCHAAPAAHAPLRTGSPAAPPR